MLRKIALLFLLSAAAVLGSEVVFAAETCDQVPALKTPRMIDLGDKYVTPDGMAYNPSDNNIYLVIPAAVEEGDAPLLVIKPDDTIEEVFRIPASPETGHAGTLGIAFGPDGNL